MVFVVQFRGAEVMTCLSVSEEESSSGQRTENFPQPQVGQPLARPCSHSLKFVAETKLVVL